MSIAKRAIDQSMREITTDSIHILAQDISACTMRELAGLIADLEALRERMAAASNRAERDFLSYARLSKSVVQLTTVASKSTVAVQQPTSGG